MTTGKRMMRIVLSLLLVLLPVYAMEEEAAVESPETEFSCRYDAGLTAQALDQPGLEESLVYGDTEERYYLLWEGNLAVLLEDEESLTDIVAQAAADYVKENTISCTMEPDERLRLCYGAVSATSPTDPEPVIAALRQEMQFVTVEQVVVEKTIPFEQETVYDPDIYEDEPPVITTPGRDGRMETVTLITSRNGEAQSRDSQSEVTVEPVTEITTAGSKERPKYVWPVSGRVTSAFGYRNVSVGSRYHQGIDIAVSTGTTVRTARAGTVSYAGWCGGYGYLVIVQHGDGASTYYGHNSSVLVSRGEQVSQGEAIARSGNTGTSTGPHCHFEIRIDGTAVNPMRLLP